ncbi:MAG: RIP metalloprotease RseP [Thermodesulfovibrionales bacterium]
MIILSAAVLLGALIFVHELGHFLVAKSLGIKVLKFSLGFGPKLFGRKHGETEYLISALPLGGYVKMLGEDPDEKLDEAEAARAYNRQPVWKRFAVVFSGPLFNLGFAAVLLTAVYYTGIPVPYPDLGKPAAGSSAERAGIQAGDRVVEMNGKAIASWKEIDDALTANKGSLLRLRVKRGGEILEFSLQPERKTGRNFFGEPEPYWDAGLTLLMRPVVGEVMRGSPAEQAGLKKGDVIVSIGGTNLSTWQEMTALIHENPDRPLVFVVRQNGTETEKTITPRAEKEKLPDGAEKTIGRIGVKPESNEFPQRHAALESVRLGFERTWDIAVLTLVSIVKLLQRIVPADTIGGPILIAQMAEQQASLGYVRYVMFMAVISINLGVLNLLPIPVLDGGHLLFLGIEAMRRKPVSERIVIMSQRIGIALLVALMVFAFYNDIVRLLTGKMF